MRPGAARQFQGKIEVFFLVAAAVFIFLLLFRLPFYPFFHESDQLIFLYNADRMLQGEYLYRDFFQFTFPGGQVLYYFLLKIFGTHYWVLPLAIIAMGTMYAWVLLRISKHIIPGPLCYLPPLLYIFFGFRWFGLDGSHRMFSPLFVLFAVLVLLKGSSFVRLSLAGFLCALSSFFTQQRGMVAVAALVVFVIAECYVKGWHWGKITKQIAVLSGSFAVSLAALCVYFILTAGLDTFVHSTFVFPSLYYHYHEENDLGAFWVGFRGLLGSAGFGPRLALLPALFYGFAIPLSLVAFWITAFKNRKTIEWDHWRGAVLLGIVGSFAILSTTNPGHLRYFQLSGPMLVLIAWLFQHYRIFEKRRVVFISITAVLFMGVSAVQAIRQQTTTALIRIDAARGTVYAPKIEQTERYLWIQERTEPGDKVFETSNPYIYFLFGLRNPSRYTQVFDTELSRPEFIEWAIEDLSKDPPRFILWNNSYIKPDKERLPGDHTGPLANFVTENYAPASPIYIVDGRPIQVWEKIGPEQH